MDITNDLELLSVTVLTAVMFTVLCYFYLNIVGGTITLTMAAVIGGLGGLFGYTATRMLFSQAKKKRKK